MTSIDNVVRINHGNDFTLVDKNEFQYNLNELFLKAERIRLDLEGLSQGSMKKEYFDKFNEIEEIISYKNKPEEERQKLYYDLILLDNQKKVFNLDYEQLREN